MKKIISMLLALTLLLGCMVPAALAEKKLSVVTTTFPIYDWVRQVIGTDESIELTLLLDSGVDLHSFNPTAADIMRIATCDLFLYIGGESDDWVEDALSRAINADLRAVSLMEALGEAAREEEIVEGMQAEEEDDEDEEEDPEYD